MLLHQIIEHKKFCLKGSIAFDFSNDFPITFVQFLNFSNDRDLEIRTTNLSKQWGVNYVVIIGGDSNKKNDFRYNLDGIKGLSEWQDPYYIGIFVKQLLLKHTSKYNIFYGDCAGAYTALIASKNGPVNAIVLTTPTINASDFSTLNIEHVQGLIFRKNIQETINIDTKILDAFPILINNVNQGVRTTIHWAKTVYGSDFYEKTRTSSLPKNLNLEIVEHKVPPEIDPHFLVRWLHDTKQITNIVKNEVKIGQAILSTKNII
jgi:hypothetical protein